MKMLKTFPPRALLMAALPRPWRATSMDANTFGNDVPAAEKVMPITMASMPRSNPSFSRHSVMTKLISASQNTLMAIVWRYLSLLPSARTSATV